VTEPIAFALAVLALLATPGPTNTLLATSGAAAGFQRSLHLIAAEFTGYFTSIAALALVIAPLVRESHALDIALRIACGAYLLYAAWRLWQEGAAVISSGEPVKFRRVLVATLLNPKAIVFTFVIVPHLSDHRFAEALPYLGALGALIAVVGGAWIGVGAAVRAGVFAGGDRGYARRAGALVLCVFAVLVSGSALTS
jgi:threonine/homoserine/homoserine lactone efflux protein